MNGDPNSSNEERFLYHLERALKHLYDPPELRSNPLVSILYADPRADPVFALRDLLIKSVESLVPQASAPEGARAWRIYHILHRRYTEQRSQKQVAADLGLSVRQLQREERLARQVLADHLRINCGLEERLTSLPPAPTEPREDADGLESGTPARADELQQLDSAVPVEVTNLSEVIREILELTRPLMQTYQVSVQTSIATILPNLPLKTLLLRQALLDIVGMAMRYTANGQIVVGADCAEQIVSIRIAGARRDDFAFTHLPVREGLEIAEQLIGLCGGALRRTTELSWGEQLPLPAAPTFGIEITFPIKEWIKVLVIDDNADARLLFQRYLAGSRYHVIGAADGRQGVKLAQDLQPDVILLDIMMPEHDGWEILGQLRVHPQTRSIPVFVCSILAQEELALALGAAQFVRKPVNQSALLMALERQLGPTRQESD
jgi:CheY-like chemotaxis protein